MTASNTSINTDDTPAGALKGKEAFGLYVFFSAMIFTLGVAGGLASLPVSFYLKNTLHLSPNVMARFGAIVSLPSYFGFVAGFVRDRWKPFRQGDAGYFILTLPILASINLWLAYSHLSYNGILYPYLVFGIVSSLLSSALAGMEVSAAQRFSLSGRMVAMSAVIGVLPGIVTSVSGGWLTSHVPVKTVFIVSAGVYGVALLLSFWRPKSVFELAPRQIQAAKESAWHAIVRMVRHRELWPSYLIMFLFVFAPGWGTPLFYYLTDTVHLTEQQYGNTQAFGGVAVLFVGFSYGYLCQKIRLKSLLFVGTILAVISGPAYLLIHNYKMAMVVTLGTGILVGYANSAYKDLLFRSYPTALEGTGTAIMSSITSATNVSSDLVGAALYTRGGFKLALIITTITTALILPALLLVPRKLTQGHDGDPLLELIVDPE